MNNDCIFSEYFTNSKECDRQYKCDGCPIRDEVHSVIREVLANE